MTKVFKGTIKVTGDISPRLKVCHFSKTKFIYSNYFPNC